MTTALRAAMPRGLPYELRPQEVAERIGVSVSRLEHWRRNHIAPASSRTAGGHHRYTPSDVRRLRLLVVLLRPSGPLSLQAARRTLPFLHELIESLIDEAARGALDSAAGEGRCSPLRGF